MVRVRERVIGVSRKLRGRVDVNNLVALGHSATGRALDRRRASGASLERTEELMLRSVRMDDSTRKLILDQAAAAVEVRNSTAYGRAIQGKGPLDVTICLGTPRCGFPKQGWEERVCPFCLRLPSNTSASDVAEVTGRFIKGN